jgi:hypothetical protein
MKVFALRPAWSKAGTKTAFEPLCSRRFPHDRSLRSRCANGEVWWTQAWIPKTVACGAGDRSFRSG